MEKTVKTILWAGKIAVGCAIYSLGFDLFLGNNSINAGGLTGLAQIFVNLAHIGSVGTVVMLMNLPLFIIGGLKVGRKFFVGSLIGTIASSVFLDLFVMFPFPESEPLVAALYGGVLTGLGLGIVFAAGASTGGSDIAARLLKLKYENVPIGTISMGFDMMVVLLTGLVFMDLSKALYSGVALFGSGQVMDAVVYRFDYSKTAMIISSEYETIAREIGEKLDRGATFLNGEGSYSGRPVKVVFTVVKRGQVAELKRLVMEIDPNAFFVVQEAHQVLGEGFSRYSRESL